VTPYADEVVEDSGGLGKANLTRSCKSFKCSQVTIKPLKAWVPLYKGLVK